MVLIRMRYITDGVKNAIGLITRGNKYELFPVSNRQ